MAGIGDIIDGRYKIIEEIGRGGMSIVYMAKDLNIGMHWAIKEIRKFGSQKDKIIVDSLIAEANLMKLLDYPAFPRIVAMIDHGVTLYVVMDYIEGASLDKILEEKGPLPEELVMKWTLEICNALSYLHLAKSPKPVIIYRDMKPANVMLKDDHIKIIDFGIAREFKGENWQENTGSKGYAPPEQYNCYTDARSDIYALGMTMHHLLTGVYPKQGEYAPVRIWNPNLSEGIEYVIDKCVQDDPDQRYQNCEELIYDLEHLEQLTKPYRKKQILKLSAFIIAVAMFVLMLALGVVCAAVSTNIKNNNYETLISPSTATDLEEKIDSYRRAIEIYPERTDAYLCMLAAYEDEGRFSKAQSDQFLAAYNANKDKFDPSEITTAILNYEIGIMYFNYYTQEDGSVSFATRVQKAYSFFTTNHENINLTQNYENQALSDCYYQICYFYKTYILSSATIKEASKDDYVDLFQKIDDTMGQVEGAGAYDQLSLYNGIFMLLYDQRSNMAQVGVDLQEILDRFDAVYKRAELLEVKKAQSKSLQQEMMKQYQSYREALERSYTNAKEGR